jgi:peptidyl-prolyl cis-trans isomerase SurA
MHLMMILKNYLIKILDFKNYRMIIKKTSFIVLIILFCLNANSLENKILIKVDNEIITSVDIFKETQYLIAINKDIQKLSQNRIFEIAKNSLIRRTIKQNEISKYINNADLDEEFTNQLIKSNAIKLGFKSVNDFQDHLMNFDIKIKTIKNRLSTEVLWNELIVKKYSNKLTIDIEKIKKEVLSNDKKIKSYLLSEIIFNLSAGTNIEKKFQIIENEISETGFDNAALIYSMSDTSSSGGKLGWFKETSLNKAIKKEILNLKIGEHTKPIKISGGFLVLKVENIKEINQKIDLKKELEKRIINEKNQQLNQFSLIYYNKIKKDVKIDEL